MHSINRAKEAARVANVAATAEFLARGGKIRKVPCSKRALNGTQMDLACRGETQALENYNKLREAAQADVAGRRAQRG